MAALQYIDDPSYSALIVRRSFTRLTQSGAIMDRSKEWMMGTDAKWSEGLRTWRFPSGARLTFGHMDDDNAMYNYQGANWQFVGYDELSEFKEPMYTYLFTRMRRTEGSTVPIRMRATANPGGIGHEWVRGRFQIQTGKPIKPGRRFISAKLADNPSMDAADYIATFEHTDAKTREQILDGDWTAGDDALLDYAWLEACETDELPPMNVRPEKYVGVDIGRTNDRTAIWTWQRVGDIAWCAECHVMHGATYREQREAVLDRLDRFVVKCQIDKGGIGNQLAEELCRDRPAVCVGVQLSQGEQGRLASQMSVAFSESKARIPTDPEIKSDFRLVKRVDIRNGVAVVKTDRNETGHADRFWAAALGLDPMLWQRRTPAFSRPVSHRTRSR